MQHDGAVILVIPISINFRMASMFMENPLCSPTPQLIIIKAILKIIFHRFQAAQQIRRKMKLLSIIALAGVSTAENDPRTPTRRLKTMKNYMDKWIDYNIGQVLNRPGRAHNLVSIESTN